MGNVNYKLVETRADIEEFSKLADDIYHEYFVPLIMEKDQADYMVEKFLSPSVLESTMDEGYEYYFMRSDDGTDIGFIAIECTDHDMFLSKLYVRKGGRGGGIGTSALNFLKKICSERGLSSIWLTCNRRNENSLAFYRHIGFVEEGSVDTDIGNGYIMDDYVMRLYLDER